MRFTAGLPAVVQRLDGRSWAGAPCTGGTIDAVSVKVAVLGCLGVAVIAVGLEVGAHRIADERRQDALDAFYATPPGIDDASPGTVFQIESLGSAPVVGASSFRILYRTERPDGSAAVSGAMVFVPFADAPPGGRPVLAYAHGTTGMGRGCAPSRRSDPIGDDVWFAQAIAAGFVVVATDYAGLGTAGPNLYLIGESESLDIVNSVRALDHVPGADPGRKWAVYGYSQGGHSALWTGELAANQMPERMLVGVAAAAPAADLSLIMANQWSSGVGWGVGAEVASAWPAAYPGLDFSQVISSDGHRWTADVADACLRDGLPVPPLLGLIASSVGVPYFDHNPLEDRKLAAAVEAQTPKPLPANLPLLIAQGTADSVIPPGSNATLQQTWCAAGSNLTMLWLGGVGHANAGTTAAPIVVSWLRDRFDQPAPRPACADVPPVVGGASLLGDLLNR